MKCEAIEITKIVEYIKPDGSTKFVTDIPVVVMCKLRLLFRKDMVNKLESQSAWTIPSKKSRIYDSYGIIEKSAWIWRLLALFPFTVKYAMGIKKYKINGFLAVYNILVPFVCIANVTWGLINFSEIRSGKSITVGTATVLIRAASGLLCMIISSTVRIFFHRDLTESIESLANQETFLEKIGCRINHGKIAKIVFAYVLSTFFIMSWLMVFDLVANNHSLGWAQWLLWISPLVAQVVNLTIFVTLVGMLGLKFRALNEKIRIIMTRANASSPKFIVTSNVCAENLRLTAKAHYNICAIGKRINNFFTWDLIINVVTAFVILSSTLYYIFVEVQKKGETSSVRIGTYIHWEIMHSVPIIIVVIICNWTSHQSNYAGKFIHEIRVQKMDSLMYEAIKSFSLQLHHQKLEFTGGGLFPLNSTLLQTMVGNITTYLVILIQFHPPLDF